MVKFEYECYPYMFPDPKEIYCSKQVLLEEDLVLPCTKPDIESIVDVRSNPIIEEFKIIKNPVGQKLFIEGRVEQEILYVAQASCQPVHAAHFTVQFRTFILLPSSCRSYLMEDYILPKILVEFIQAKPLRAREISKCLILFIWCPILHQSQPIPRPKPSQYNIHCPNNAKRQGRTGSSTSYSSPSRHSGCGGKW